MADIFDPTTVDDNGFTVLQPGAYRAVVEFAEIKPTKAGTGRYVQVNLTVTDPKAPRAKIRAYLNFENQNATAQSIGRAQLKKFLASVGITTAVDLEKIAELTKGKVTTAEVDIEDGRDGPMNKVTGFIAPTTPPATADEDSIPF